MMQPQATPPRLLLNARRGATNVLTFAEFSEVAWSVVTAIEDKVLMMYGPNAMSTLLIPDVRSPQPQGNVFTSDGINVLKSIEFVNPIESHVADFIRYIGDRVEKRSGDGSSTAILLACAFMRKIIDSRGAISQKGSYTAKPERTTNLKRQFERFIDMALKHLETTKVTIDDLEPEVRKKLLHSLVMTSSKGEKELADMLSEILTFMPEVMRGSSIFDREDYETETKWKTRVPESDFYMKLFPSNLAKNNHKMFTEIYHENADILFLPMLPQTPEELVDFATGWMDNGEGDHLVIVTPTASNAFDSVVEAKIDHSRVTYTNRSATSQLHMNNPIDIISALAISGKSWDQTMTIDTMYDLLVEGVTVHIANNEMSVFGLYEPVNGLHPLYVNKQSEFYNNHEEEMRKLIFDLVNAVSKTDENQQNLKFFYPLYRKLTCWKMPMLVIGGSTTEHLHAVDVAHDVTMVISDVLESGVVFDLLPKLQYIFNLIASESMRMPHALNDMITVSYGREVSLPSPDAVPSMMRTHEIPLQAFLKSEDEEWLSYNEEQVETPEVVQSYEAIRLTLVRIKEALAPLATTETILVRNSVNSAE